MFAPCLLRRCFPGFGLLGARSPHRGFPQVVLCTLSDWCLVCLFAPCLLRRSFQSFGYVGCRVSMLFANVLGRFVGLVFGLFVCALFVTALFFRFRDVRQSRACTYMVRTWLCRVGVWSVCLRPVCCGAVFRVVGCPQSASRLSGVTFHKWFCALCRISVWFVCIRPVFYGAVFFGFGLVGCRVSMFLANIFVRFVVFEDVRQPGACT